MVELVAGAGVGSLGAKDRALTIDIEGTPDIDNIELTASFESEGPVDAADALGAFNKDKGH